MFKDVSLIIPCKNNKESFLKLMTGVKSWVVTPSEIIIVDSSKRNMVLPRKLKVFLKETKIKLKVIKGEKLFPGHARNIGLSKSTNSLVAFLDTSTHPSNEWLSRSISIIEQENCDGVWGNTHYQADSYIMKIFRACSYGEAPVQTLPGSVFKKSVFEKCGLFIESTRAGEDGDWMSRTRLHQVNISLSEEFLRYDELNKSSIKDLLKKWFRNYTYGARLPLYRPQKDLYYYVISFISILLAYNWNGTVASWDTDNFLYIPNITTGLFLLLCLGYVVLRGIVVPLKKGVKPLFIFPVNFFLITLMSSLFDLVKLIAFGYSRFIKK